MALKTGRLYNRTRGSDNSLTVQYCDRFICRLRGLMFRKSLPPNWGLLLVQKRPGRLDAAVHMLWMRFKIAVIWLDEEWAVVDARIAHPWRSFLVPERPAQYVLETAPEHLGRYRIGDELYLDLSTDR